MDSTPRRTRGPLGLIVLALLAAGPAAAQFSTPYDPDFAPAPPAATAAAPETSTAAAEVVPILIPAAPGKPVFLLLQRPDPAHILPAEETSTAPATTRPEAGLTLERYWKVRDQVDRGEQPGEGGIETPEQPSLTETGAVAVSTAAPKPPPPEIELPTYGTSLSVTGRKIIGVNYSEKQFTHDQSSTGRARTTNLIDISQQLQLRMQGKIGPKITVNVDYDDTKPNQQDISVIYQGDPNETVQNVSFGDINLALPATEFVSYNKQLFGIRADVKYKGFKFTLIGSRTKGTTKTKQFHGNAQFVSEDLLDTSYVRHQYYDLTFGSATVLPIRSGTEHVYLATQALGLPNANQQTLTVDDINFQGSQVNTSSFTGVFQLLSPGQDYTINYAQGYIQLRNAAQAQFVLAADYLDANGNELRFRTSSETPAGGGDGLFKLIKTPSDLPIISSTTESGFTRELKTFYSLGQTSIIPDNGQGNFILKVLNASRQEVGSTLNPIQQYPATINVDFTNGIAHLLQPFAVVGDSSTIDPNIYAPTPITQRLIHTEFNYRFKTFTLEPNLVTQSELVLLDNSRLTRNVDYFIDYVGGFVTFFNPQRIGANSEIDITYEVSPFVGANNDTLLGGRVSYDFNQYVSLGGTLLYDVGTKPQTTPQITEIAKSLFVYDFDAQVKKMKIGEHLNMTLSGEFAQSHTDPNLNAYAIVDNMEGIQQQIPANMLFTAWQIASNPGGLQNPTRLPSDPSKVTWTNEGVPTLQINPSAPATNAATTNVLDLNYDFTNPNSQEMSIVFPFSISGLDMSQSSFLQIVMLGDGSNNQLNFHLGGINEDADATGGTTLVCANGQVILNAPKTEDVNCDGILQPSEDIGWCYSYPPSSLGTPNPCAARFGANNGKIDSEDMDGNPRSLEPGDLSGDDFGYFSPNNPNFPDATTGGSHLNGTIDASNFGPTSWHTLQIPLNISSTTALNWTAIRQLRVSVMHGAGGANTGTLKFASIAVVGNSWLRGQPGDPSLGTGAVAFETMTVTAVNNVSNPNYVPIYNAGGDAQTVFNELYGSVANLQKLTNTQNISEQALQLSYAGLNAPSFTPPGISTPTVFTKRVFPNAIDISQHHEFNFLLYGNAQTTLNPPQPTDNNEVFFLRAGTDLSYVEVRVPVNFTGWKLIKVKQNDPGNGVMNGWISDTPGTVIVSSNAPSLQNVGELVAGIYATPTTPPQAQGTVFLDEIFMSQPAARTGTAEKLQADFEVPGWSTFGFKHRSVDMNFQTPTSVVSNQDVDVDNAYLNILRWRWLPLTFNVNRTVTNTPSTINTGNLSNLVNLLQQGKVTTLTETGRANVAYGAYPRLNLNYTRTLTDYDLLARQDDKQVYGATLQYGFPTQRSWVPRTLDLNYSFTNYDVLYKSDLSRSAVGDYDATEHDYTYGTRLTFVPWTGSSFNPNYSMTTGSERRTDYTSGAPQDSEYPKSYEQDVGFTSNYRLTKWLNPQVSYQMQTIAASNLSVSTFVVNNTTVTYNPGDLKNVTRSSNGSISVPLTIGDVFPKSTLFKSLSIVSGYQLQDGDSWNNVNQDENLSGLLSVRQPLHPTAAAAQLVSLTERDTFNSTQRWSPLQYYNLSGRSAALKTLSLSNNFVDTVQRSDVTGTVSKTVTQTPIDTVVNLSKLEQLLHAERWMSNGQVDFRYSLRTTENVGASLDTQNAFGGDLRMLIRKKYDFSLGYNLRTDVNEDLVVGANTQNTYHQDATAQVTFDYKKFRFTPKIDYTFDQTTTGAGIKTQDVTVITPSLLTRADLALPAGLRLPGSSRPLLFSNRIIWTTTLSLADRRSPVSLIDNSLLASLTTSADYEIAKNLRMTINGSLQRLWHQYLLTENYISYSFGTNLTFQF